MSFQSIKNYAPLYMPLLIGGMIVIKKPDLIFIQNKVKSYLKT